MALQYKRNDVAFSRGNFRVRGDTIELFPSHYDDTAWRISFFGDEVDSIVEFDPLTGKPGASLPKVRVYANSHYVTPGPTMKQAAEAIRHELAERLKELHAEGKLLGGAAAGAAHEFRPGDDRGHGCLQRHRELFPLPDRPPARRTAAHAVRISAGERALFVDESHQTVPQVGGMARGDHRRKITLAEYGFPPAELHRQPPAALQRVGRDAPADRVRLRDARQRGRWRRPAACSPSRSSAPPA